MDDAGRTINMENGIHHNTNRSSTTNPSESFLAKVVNFIGKEMTFYRVHLAAFTFIPLIFSGIFYASNGRYHISFLDSMFLCYSAMTVTGLSTVNLSTITIWQQFILYFLMMIGDITIVSWIMVLIRKRFFVTHCEYVFAKGKKPKSIRSRASFMQSISGPVAAYKQRQPAERQEKIDKPNLPKSPQFNSSNPQLNLIGPTPGPTLDAIDERSQAPSVETLTDVDKEKNHLLPDLRTFSDSPKSENIPLSPLSEPNLRSPPTVEFAMSTTVSPRLADNQPRLTFQDSRQIRRRRSRATMLSTANPEVPGIPEVEASKAKYKGLGGFPGPTQLARQVFQLAAPHAFSKLQRTMTLPTVTTLQSENIPWLNFSGLVVGRNSNFRTDSLSDEQLEDIGGAEYRALRLLSWLAPTYFVVCQLASVLLFLPWLSVITKYDDVFQAQPRLVSKSWFSFFQVMGAYTGGGLSLVDLGMVPFQSAYLMIFALGFAILAGNHALPIFLRLIIWVSSKVLPERSESQVPLSFLLQHPRRCFLYLFPSHQTWFLVVCLVGFSIIEWIGFLVLNIGLPAYESIRTGPRVIAGLFQGLAVRASGFAIVPLSSMAPALLFLYVVMMYIAVYPVAMSIRTTNVYEEKSLGVFEAPPDDEDEEPADLSQIPSGKERVGRYIGWHLRRQLSMDIWWLVWAVFIIAIVERGNLMDPSKKWFDLFAVLFELVSAFGGIGLSLGFPDNNYSFSGAFRTLSKLVVIVIMVRGRHRGLPVAVDRAVLLPSELVVNNSDTGNAKRELEINIRPLSDVP
ncbi:potassium transporter [Gymnopilus junonius]|uniref:Potassium transporter n=1 Tax=Gymnopilus junonius TaxID=109634 RepID=A0A9P5NHH3_GYMJU|nr:potassium transporter [Gymnopilus junonius]